MSRVCLNVAAPAVGPVLVKTKSAAKSKGIENRVAEGIWAVIMRQTKHRWTPDYPCTYGSYVFGVDFVAPQHFTNQHGQSYHGHD
ncbi:hypothetical protein GQ600_26814 [Phytophthora cactorum]|nr:hypothetical protein GQ600_26814 [Phytophthora cactorum]